MTDLVAEAIALCEEEKALAVHDLVMAKTRKQIKAATTRLRMVKTHLAEFEEHENHYIEVFPSDENYWLCNGCGESNAKDVDCEKKSTKAKRLLGVSK